MTQTTTTRKATDRFDVSSVGYDGYDIVEGLTRQDAWDTAKHLTKHCKNVKVWKGSELVWEA